MGVCVKYGQQYDVEKKYAKFDEVVQKVKDAVKEPENSGTYHDYVELCKLYDKNENGTMMLAELENFLSNLGDEIPKEDTAKLLDELADKEMKMVSFLMFPSLTDCAAKHKYRTNTAPFPLRKKKDSTKFNKISNSSTFCAKSKGSIWNRLIFVIYNIL